MTVSSSAVQNDPIGSASLAISSAVEVRPNNGIAMRETPEPVDDGLVRQEHIASSRRYRGARSARTRAPGRHGLAVLEGQVDKESFLAARPESLSSMSCRASRRASGSAANARGRRRGTCSVRTGRARSPPHAAVAGRDVGWITCHELFRQRQESIRTGIDLGLLENQWRQRISRTRTRARRRPTPVRVYRAGPPDAVTRRRVRRRP